MKRTLDTIALLLIVIGGLNWGLVGLFKFDLVQAIFGGFTVLARIVYVLVAIAAVYTVVRAPGLLHIELHHHHPTTPSQI
jgi:uncharacterized membrane protein YuzA (DUF378 family)